MSRTAINQKFLYRAIGAGAGLTEGEIEAPDGRRAREELRRRGLVALDVRSADGAPARAGDGRATRGSLALRRPTGRDGAWRRTRAEAFALLSLLLESGMSLDAALETVVGAAGRPRHKDILRTLAGAVREGRTLAEGLRRLPEWFEQRHMAMVQAGEDSGRLPEVLRRINEQEEHAQRLRQQLASALTYPAILIVAGTLIVAFIVSFVVPRLSKMFDDMNITMPTFSRVVIGACTFLGDWGALFAAALGVAFFVARSRLRDPDRRAAFERWLLGRPMLGPIWWKHQAAGFCGAAAMMLRGGIPILRALEIARTTWRSEELRRRLDAVIGHMREGGRLSDAARQARLFPDVSDRLIAVGEEGGNLPTVFERLSKSMEDDVSIRMNRALTLLGPLAILAIASIVAVVVIAMLLAIFSMNDLQAI
ncbi:MAG: type II secretion system F family protein [Phycisphaerales bacterium]|nr:type II secretion system F family protein [Phycisphaerales bacterium]